MPTAGRMSPDSPTSPTAIRPGRSGRPSIALPIARAMARSAAGSVRRTPPTVETNASLAPTLACARVESSWDGTTDGTGAPGYTWQLALFDWPDVSDTALTWTGIDRALSALPTGGPGGEEPAAVTVPETSAAELAALAPAEPVLLRGLGLNFFDHLALLTSGRGGRFVREDSPDSQNSPYGRRLRYVPSGKEPRLFAGSRRGVPYHARGDNEKGAHGRHEPLVLTPETVARLRRRAMQVAEAI